LHQAEDGMWLAYSRWPDKATHDTAWPDDDTLSDILPEDIKQDIVSLKDCGDPDRRLPELCLEVVDDLLLNS